MQRLVITLVPLVVLLAMAVAPTAQVSALGYDDKHHPGSLCTFADNPLATFNRIGHVFNNLSGTGQWMSCPTLGDRTETLKRASVEVSQAASNVRLEARNDWAGTLVGYNADSSTAIGSGGAVRYNWNLHGSLSSAAAVEMFLPANAVIYQYVFSEHFP
jgi:hypothetical protein